MQDESLGETFNLAPPHRLGKAEDVKQCTKPREICKIYFASPKNMLRLVNSFSKKKKHRIISGTLNFQINFEFLDL